MCQYCQGEKPIVNGKEWEVNVENKYGEERIIHKNVSRWI